jgi:hypothetical protein
LCSPLSFFPFSFEEFILFLSYNKYVSYTNTNPFGGVYRRFFSMNSVEVGILQHQILLKSDGIFPQVYIFPYFHYTYSSSYQLSHKSDGIFTSIILEHDIYMQLSRTLLKNIIFIFIIIISTPKKCESKTISSVHLSPSTSAHSPVPRLHPVAPRPKYFSPSPTAHDVAGSFLPHSRAPLWISARRA